MFRIKHLAAIFAAFVLVACQPADQQSSEASVDLSSDSAIISYGVGQNMAASLQQNLPDLDIEALVAGIRDGIIEADPRISDDEFQAAVDRYTQQQEADAVAAAQATLEAGQAFLAENATKEGVMTTDSGLQYEVIREGDGESPVAESRVVTNYEGTLIDGSVFDSSYERGQPAEFVLNQVIPGWTEALQLMKEGGEMRIYLPPDLAYGSVSPGPGIPANSVLIFKIELIDVVSEDASTDQG